jgi:hypothetical protein
MFHREDGIALPLADDDHPSAGIVEQYSMGRLGGSELREFEEHMLMCEVCQDRLALEDAFTQGIRSAAEAPRHAASAPARWSFQLWPQPWVLAIAAAACGILILVAFQSFSSHPIQAPALVLLETTRGTDSIAISSGRPIMLALDLASLPRLPEYRLEVVDSAGRPALQSTAIPKDNQLRMLLARGLHAGVYFARVYAPSRELLREYALTVGR